MMIQAVLGNPSHPEYGVATIPFPIPHDQYAHCMELLAALEIGDAVKADCKNCPYPRHGFLCWGTDGTCLRTRMNKINGSEENKNDDSSGSQ